MPEMADAIDNLKFHFDAVQASMKTAEAQLAKVKAEHAQWTDKLVKLVQEHAAKVSELEAKKVAADRAAEENARRIKLNNDQVAEITRIRADLDNRAKALAQRELVLTSSTHDLQRRMNSATALEADLTRREADIRARFAKMKEAMA